jgi:hypothetical protein
MVPAIRANTAIIATTAVAGARIAAIEDRAATVIVTVIAIAGAIGTGIGTLSAASATTVIASHVMGMDGTASGPRSRTGRRNRPRHRGPSRRPSRVKVRVAVVAAVGAVDAPARIRTGRTTRNPLPRAMPMGRRPVLLHR